MNAGLLEQTTPTLNKSFYGWVSDLVHQNRSRLVRVVRREGVRSDDALDCVQDAFVTFLTLPQARSLVGQPTDSSKMLTILARNIARNRRRRHDYSRSQPVDDAALLGVISEAPSVDEVIATAEMYALAVGCMTTLNEIQRAVVRLRLLEEIPGENVAKQLGTSSANVAILLLRAKRHLRQCLDNSEGPSRPDKRKNGKGLQPVRLSQD